MAYEVTANKKRPQFLEELVGQEFVVTTLQNSIKAGNPAHAYLFSGPRGVGKTSAARILAKALNCEKGTAEGPCGECSHCQSITRGNCMDVFEIDGASNTSVDDVRQIKDEVLFAPGNSRFKIFIIDEVHMLSNSAFNALLKTIEEPPPYIVFIFATTEIHKVPATVRSRCQQFNFRLIALDKIKERLKKLCDESGVKAEDAALLWISKEATGSLRDAYTLFDQVLSFSGKEIRLKVIQDKLGVSGFDAVSELVKLMIAEDRQALMEYSHTLLESGISVEQFIRDLADFFRIILFVKQGVSKENILGISLKNVPQEIPEAFSVEQLEKGLELLLDLFRKVRYSLSQRFELDLVLSQLASLKRYIGPDKVINSLENIREKLRVFRETAVLNAAAPSTDQDTMIVTDQNYQGDIKSDLVDELKEKKLTLATTLQEAYAWDLSEKELDISFLKDFHLNIVNNEKDYIRDMVSKIIGRPIEVSFKLVQEQVEEKEESNPLVQNDRLKDLKDVFRAEILDDNRGGR